MGGPEPTIDSTRPIDPPPDAEPAWSPPPDVPSDVMCYITAGNGADRRTVYLDTVTRIDETFNTELFEQPLITYPAEDRFVMDMGITRKLTLHIKRVNPQSYNDNGPQQKWSNAKWYRNLQDTFDFWQNLSEDSMGRMAGGAELIFRSSDETMYPSIGIHSAGVYKPLRVFLMNSLVPDFHVGVLDLTINLVAASLVSDDTHPAYTRVHYRPAVVSAMNGIDLDEVVIEYPQYMPVTLPGLPIEWKKATISGFMQSQWRCRGESGHSDGGIYRPGQRLIFGD